MILSEANWLGKNIKKYLSTNSVPVLNLGSSTFLFRTKTQPLIDKLVVRPIEKITNSKIVHCDFKNGPGVDLIGDIYNKNLQNDIIKRKFKTIICANLIEQVDDPVKAILILSSFVIKGGLIFVTVPSLFPYHPDPIDNLFRPSPRELFNYFDKNNFILLEEEIVFDAESYFSYLTKNPRLLANRIIRFFTPFYKFQSWRHQMVYLPHYFSKFRISCIIIKRVV